MKDTAVTQEVDVVTEYCNWEACRTAIQQGFKKGKGLGGDGFDGYMVRVMGERMQKRYWRILRGMVKAQRYPAGWNEWIAMLLMKPGEDPKNLERRRDIWLQCHSLKCVTRMILPAYEGATDRNVGVMPARIDPASIPPA